MNNIIVCTISNNISIHKLIFPYIFKELKKLKKHIIWIISINNIDNEENIVSIPDIDTIILRSNDTYFNKFKTIIYKTIHYKNKCLLFIDDNYIQINNLNFENIFKLYNKNAIISLINRNMYDLSPSIWGECMITQLLYIFKKYDKERHLKKNIQSYINKYMEMINISNTIDTFNYTDIIDTDNLYHISGYNYFKYLY